MTKAGLVTKIFLYVGVFLVLSPIVLAFVFSIVSLIGDGRLRIDFMIPAEVFPAGLVGGFLLVIASFRVKKQQKLIGLSYGAAIVMLVGGQALAVLTGLASGDTPPTSWIIYPVLGSIFLYSVALIGVGVGGCRLISSMKKSR